MVKIEKISPGAAASILRNGERVAVIEKQLINYDEADTLEVTGGEVIYSINETEVITKRSEPAPVVSSVAAKPALAATTETAVKPVIVKPVAKTTKK